MTWNPVEEPYRVGIFHRGPHLPHGWRFEVVAMYKTEAEARAAVEAPLPAGGVYWEISLAVNAETWQKNGRWKRVFRRERKKK